EGYGQRFWFVPLADITDAGLVLDTVLTALDLPRGPNLEPLEQIARGLGQHPSLLILDNFEQLVDGGAAVLWALLKRIPALTCVVTSRQRLGLAGEREFAVQPLPVPADGQWLMANGPEPSNRPAADPVRAISHQPLAISQFASV